MGVISCGTTMIDQGQFEGLDVLSWDTTAKTANFTAVAGNGYFVNTTSTAITVTLPASPSAGDQVAIKDYAATAATNNILIARNSSNISGEAGDVTIAANGISVLFLYVDATQGWSQILTGENLALGEKYVTATGGTITTSGDYKIHKFTGPGTFTVTCAGTPLGSNQVDYMIVAGGGGAGPSHASGGGAGGFRETPGSVSGCYTASPIAGSLSAFSVAATAYPVVVGAGGAGGFSGNSQGSDGSDSSIFGFSSAGGGAGQGTDAGTTGNSGGSGGGGAGIGPRPSNGGGAGNTPSTAPAQGTPGGNGSPFPGSGIGGGGGGGGATVAGSPATPAGGGAPSTGGDGGDGATTNISGSPLAFAGGGGGGGWSGGNSCGGAGGGGGGKGNSGVGIAGTVNTGGGGGGTGPGSNPSSANGAGGSGIVYIRYKYQ